MTLEHKKSIVRWIMDNPGYVYSQFTFKPEYEDEVLPTEEDFEALTYDLNKWVIVVEAGLDDDEKKMYPGATQRYKYIFQPLNGGLYAQIFVDDDNNVQYVVILS